MSSLTDKQKIRINRDVLEKFLPNKDAIRKFEDLLRLLNDLIPEDLQTLLDSIEESEIQNSSNTSKINSVNSLLQILKQEIEILKSKPNYNTPNKKPNLEYIDMNLNPNVSDKQGRLSWDNLEDTLNIVHKNGVVQQVGQELFMQVKNDYGANMPNGTLVSFSGVNGEIKVNKYIADGSISNIYFIGVLTQELDDGEIGKATLYGNVRDINTTGSDVSETWSKGDILYASPTNAGKLTKVRPTAPDEVVVVAIVRVVDSTDGEIMIRPTIPQGLHYAQFSDTTNQTLTTANTAYPVTFNTTDVSNGLSVVSGSQITTDHAGLFLINFSLQITSSNSSSVTAYAWLRKNGVDVPRSRYDFTIKANGDTKVLSGSFQISLLETEYIELMWASDSTHVLLDYIASTAFAPEAPSAIVSITQIQL